MTAAGGRESPAAVASFQGVRTMPSPFPGMNPYFEQPDLWRSFHTNVLVYLREAIATTVPPGYFVDVEESLYVRDDPDGPRRLFGVADVTVSGATAAPVTAFAAATAAPVTAGVPRPRRRPARRLVVRTSRSREVVTVIELLSPANKNPGRDRVRFIDRRAAVLDSAASYVELDLLRGGRRLPVRRLPACDYYVLVGRAWERPRVGLWPLGLRDELPAVPIPLRPGEVEPRVPLKPILDRLHDTGYAREIYARPPDPPLSAADAAWAEALIPRGEA